MFLADLAGRLEAYRTLSGDARAEVAQSLLADFKPLIGEATRVTYYRGVCGIRREWFHNAQYWFLIYLDEYVPSDRLMGAGYFVAYMKRCLTMRLLYERQREETYQARNQFIDFRPCGGNQAWPPPLLRALRELCEETEDQAIARIEESRLLAFVDALPPRERDIYLTWYFRGRVPAQRMSARFGIGTSRVNQLKQHAVMTVSKHLVA